FGDQRGTLLSFTTRRVSEGLFFHNPLRQRGINSMCDFNQNTLSMRCSSGLTKAPTHGENETVSNCDGNNARSTARVYRSGRSATEWRHVLAPGECGELPANRT